MELTPEQERIMDEAIDEYIERWTELVLSALSKHGDHMRQLTDYLRCFNRKERFSLVALALGNPQFRLSREFRDALHVVLKVDVPEDAFVAMDYHLDWIYASLHLYESKGDLGPHSNLEGLIRAHQEDIDLLVAFEEQSVSHVILLEAKGVGGFINKQMSSKARRFKEIFGQDGKKWPDVVPYFAIVSPTRPRRLNTADWPSWMLGANGIPRIEMEMGLDLKRITRCTVEGVPLATGKYWKVVSA